MEAPLCIVFLGPMHLMGPKEMQGGDIGVDFFPMEDLSLDHLFEEDLGDDLLPHDGMLMDPMGLEEDLPYSIREVKDDHHCSGAEAHHLEADIVAGKMLGLLYQAISKGGQVWNL